MNSKKNNYSNKNLNEISLIIRYLWFYKGYILTSLILLIISIFLSMGFPYFMGELIGTSAFNKVDNSNTTNSIEHINNNINRISIIIISILFVQGIAAFIRIRLFDIGAEKALIKMRRDILASMIRLPMKYYGNKNSSDINNSFTADIVLVRDIVVNNFPQVVRQSLVFLFGMFFALFVSWKLTLIMLSTIPPMIVIAIIIGRAVKRYSKKGQEHLAKSNSTVSEAMDSIKIVKVFGNEWLHLKNFYSKINEYMIYIAKEATARAFLVSFIIFALFGSITFVIWIGSGMLVQGDILPKDFFRFVMFSIFVGGAIGSLPGSISQIYKAAGACANLKILLKEEIENIDLRQSNKDEDDYIRRENGCEIEFKEVNFSYSSRDEVNILSDISFKINKNEKVALVGASGAGKSTIISLLLRLYEINKGKILINNKDINGFDLKKLRSLISLVPQDIQLFTGSILDNISYGNTKAKKEEIIKAAKMAKIHDFIIKLPNGYDSNIGEKGSQLSGGQRQRIAIARAILANTPILVLDEATSSLDSESERFIQSAVDDLIKDRTCIMIAHRLSTIKKVDKIIVFKQGKIIEMGTHDELITNKNGYYHLLANLQFMGNNL